MSHIHLDPLGGLAGDMFLGAVLDAWPELALGAFAAMRAAGLPDDWQVRHLEHGDGVLTGSRVAIDPPAAGPHAPHGMYVEIRDRIAAADLGDGVRDRALSILGHLAEAEARVHGRPIEEVHFHELADWDSIADVVGAAFVIDALGASWSTGPLPVGRGRIATSHGALPVPAPAAALLLQGFELIDDGVEGERVTPTGAAILRHLAPSPGLPPGPLAAGGHRDRLRHAEAAGREQRAAPAGLRAGGGRPGGRAGRGDRVRGRRPEPGGPGAGAGARCAPRTACST